jgi:hypothetical protein
MVIPDGSAFRPAAVVAHNNRARQPNESAEYRKAREARLAEEIELNRQIARPAERRALPRGGEVKGDYQFLGEASSVKGANPVGFADLFGDKDTCSSTTGCTVPPAGPSFGFDIAYRS